MTSVYDELRRLVSDLVLRANTDLPHDVEAALRDAVGRETSARARKALETILENAAIARSESTPICQDTGYVTVTLHVTDGVESGPAVADALQAGVADAYTRGPLRRSVVDDPVFARQNTGTNTPAHLVVVPDGGPNITLSVFIKGGGSENSTALLMLRPAEASSIVDAVVRHVVTMAPVTCPPIIVGIGIGGNAEQAVGLSKTALSRPVGSAHPDDRYAALERDIRRAVDASGIGAAGYGGDVTCLGVATQTAPCHMATLPVAISVSCHAVRRATGELSWSRC